VSGGNQRDRAGRLAQWFGDLADRVVVLPDPLGQLGVLGLDGLTSFHRTQVAVVQVGHGADNRLRLARGIAQDDHFIRRIRWQVAHDMDVQHLEQGLGRIGKEGESWLPATMITWRQQVSCEIRCRKP
jgi:hypothetical protein